jgi:hypothetical protein
MRKHNRNVVVKFLPIFTVDDLKVENPEVIDITLRYKIEQAIRRGAIKKIGKIKPDIGRPRHVYAKNPFNGKLSPEMAERKVILCDD